MMGILLLGAIVGINAIASKEAMSIPTCSSSRNVALNVTRLENVSDVYVDVYRVSAKGEELSWSGKTDTNGVTRVGELIAGKYRVFADSGTRTLEKYLSVGNRLEASTCELRFLGVSRESPQITALKTLSLKQVRGQLQGAGAPMPHAKLTLQREGDKGSGKVLSADTDDKGRFGFPNVAAGWYWVRIEPPIAFCRLLLHVEVSDDGWAGLRVSVAPLVSAYAPHCYQQSKFENIDAQTH